MWYTTDLPFGVFAYAKCRRSNDIYALYFVSTHMELPNVLLLETQDAV